MNSTVLRRERRSPASARRGGTIRNILGAAGVFTIAIVLAIFGSGVTYTLWNDSTQIDGSTLSSGSTGITIDGVTNYTFDNLDLTTIGPGQSVTAVVTLANTGTTPLSATVASTTVTSQTNAMADHLSITLTPALECAPGLAGLTAPMTGFTTVSAPLLLDVAAQKTICLEVTMNADAPPTVQGGTATFTMSIDAIQSRES